MSHRYEMDDLKLIKIVRQHAELYDVSSPGYNDAQQKEKIWTAISDEMNQPVTTCKFRWNNMRDNFRKVLKRTRRNGKKRTYKYEKELNFIIPFFKATLDSKVNSVFLQSYDETAEHVEDCIESDQNCRVDEQIVEDNESDQSNDFSGEDVKPQVSHLQASSLAIHNFINTSTALSQPIQHQSTSSNIFLEENRLNECNNEVELKNHQVDTFLAGIASTMKTLNPYYLNQAKSKIFSVVQEFELAQILNNEKQIKSRKRKGIPVVDFVYSSKDSPIL